MVAVSTGRVIAEFTSYDEMLAAIRARAAELNVNGERFDEFAGLPRGYLSKLIGASPVRRIGATSMGPLFAALGVRCVMVEDGNGTERIKTRLKPRNGSFMRASYTVVAITNRKWARIQKLGRMARWRRLRKRERSEIMRAIALKRWRG